MPTVTISPQQCDGSSSQSSKKKKEFMVDFPCGTVDEKLPVNAEDMGLIPD